MGPSKIALLIAMQAVICIISTYNVFSGPAGVSLSLSSSAAGAAASRGQHSDTVQPFAMIIGPITTYLVLFKDRGILDLLIEYVFILHIWIMSRMPCRRTAFLSSHIRIETEN